ncbi:hypothetical protein [Actinomyces succiniciruminis]|uniref:hypothetical protein n=1 Tax=Actinomyces succiniciruminis TaxID=1522002 RepID=UPI001B332F84|nr:hypothetical protein [Actinomyces succiniciruminis]
MAEQHQPQFYRHPTDTKPAPHEVDQTPDKIAAGTPNTRPQQTPGKHSTNTPAPPRHCHGFAQGSGRANIDNITE